MKTWSFLQTVVLRWFSWENVKHHSETTISTIIGLCLQKLASLETCMSNVVDRSIPCSVCAGLPGGNPHCKDISVCASEFRMESTPAPKLWIPLLQKTYRWGFHVSCAGCAKGLSGTSFGLPQVVKCSRSVTDLYLLHMMYSLIGKHIC